MSVDAPERIWAASVTDSYGEWQTVKDGLPRPVEYVRIDKLEKLAAEAHEWKDRVRYLSKCIDEKSADEDRLKAALAEAQRENEALREALERIAAPAIFFLSRRDAIEMRDTARTALARNAGGNDAR